MKVLICLTLGCHWGVFSQQENIIKLISLLSLNLGLPLKTVHGLGAILQVSKRPALLKLPNHAYLNNHMVM